MQNPEAAITVSAAGSGNTQALTGTAAKLTVFSAADTGANVLGSSKGSDYSVRPDKANNKLIVMAPGRYRLTFAGDVSLSAAATLTGKFYKGGAVISGVPQLSNKCAQDTAARVHHSAIVEITTADFPTAGGSQAFADPPTGGVIGAAFAPRNGVDIEYYGLVSSNGTLTSLNLELAAERLDG